jgi:predicted ATP-dependent serine protease
VLLAARDGEYLGLESPREVPAEIAHSPRWCTPIAEVNAATQGGIYGVTGLGGSAGAGKSFFALATALRAVLRDDQQVVYLAAEMALAQIQERMLWIAKSWGHTREQLNAELDSGKFALFYRKGRVSWRDVCGEVAAAMYEAPTGLLVIDSVNSLLASLSIGEGYWTAYESIVETLLTTRKITEGRFAALVLSELNQRGGSKGEKLEYASDLMLNFKHTTTPKVYDVRITKNRERGNDGPMGKFSITPEGGYARVSV